MKKSLFRISDVLELCTAYILLFSKFAFKLCKDYGFGFLYFKSIFEKFY